jgi:hypothetical protein
MNKELIGKRLLDITKEGDSYNLEFDGGVSLIISVDYGIEDLIAEVFKVKYEKLGEL